MNQAKLDAEHYAALQQQVRILREENETLRQLIAGQIGYEEHMAVVVERNKLRWAREAESWAKEAE